LAETALVSCTLTGKNEILIDFDVPDSLLDIATEIPEISSIDDVSKRFFGSVSLNDGISQSTTAPRDITGYATMSIVEEGVKSSTPRLGQDKDDQVSDSLISIDSANKNCFVLDRSIYINSNLPEASDDGGASAEGGVLFNREKLDEVGAIEAVEMMTMDIIPADQEHEGSDFHLATCKVVLFRDNLVHAVVGDPVRVLDAEHPLDLSSCKIVLDVSARIDSPPFPHIDLIPSSGHEISDDVLSLTDNCIESSSVERSATVAIAMGISLAPKATVISGESNNNTTSVPMVSNVIVKENRNSTVSCLSNTVNDSVELKADSAATPAISEISNSSTLHSPALICALANLKTSDVRHINALDCQFNRSRDLLKLKPFEKINENIDAMPVVDNSSLNFLADPIVKPDISTTLEEERHCVDANRSGVFVCVGCKYTTFTRDKYVQHMKAHSGRFICKACGKVLITVLI